MNSSACSKCKKRPATEGRKRCDHCRRAPREYAARIRGFRKGNDEFRAMRKEKARQQRRSEKDRVIAKFGRKCACCGETTREFLTVDHVAKDGAEHRRKLKINKNNMASFCGKLLREGRTEGIQLLCANCHLAKDLYRGCPHELERRINAALDHVGGAMLQAAPDRDAIVAEVTCILRGLRSKVGPIWPDR